MQKSTLTGTYLATGKRCPLQMDWFPPVVQSSVGSLWSELKAAPLQPAVGDPASAGGLDWVTHRGPFQPRPFSDSVTLAGMGSQILRENDIFLANEAADLHPWGTPQGTLEGLWW